LWSPFQYLGDLQYVLAAIIIIFLIGAKDDIVPVTAYKKFVVQLFAACIIVFFANIRITSFQGIFGVDEIPYILSLACSIFVIIALINAFNLIDGVDGLAGSIGILVCFTFGFWFYKVDRIELSVLSFAMIGSIVAFLYYNFTPAKIFMGDTGSLLIGLVASVLAISFMEYNTEVNKTNFYLPGGPVFAIGVLIIPIFDTLRVMLLRVLKSRSPFEPDRTHIHHVLIDLGLTHIQVTFVIVFINVFIIATIFLLKGLNINILLLVLIMVTLGFNGILNLLKKNASRKSIK
jgi:UDP-N-acetylmuramyl pentapeptide phosphotransferase/UDP-N-acetylglucosamine-1-phosphate transferase